MELLKGKTAIVTGGTRGIGFAIVKAFLDNGAKVALCGSREGTASAAVEKLKAINPDYEVMGIWPDMTDPDSIAAEFAKVKRSLRPHRYPWQQRWCFRPRVPLRLRPRRIR